VRTITPESTIKIMRVLIESLFDLGMGGLKNIRSSICSSVHPVTSQSAPVSENNEETEIRRSFSSEGNFEQRFA
jgi:hypothetical protein